MTSGKRRYLFCIAVAVMSILAIAWYLLRLQAIDARVERRAEWVRKAEAELKDLVRRPLPDLKAPGVPPWRDNQVVRFQKGWAVGRVHTMHDDEAMFSLSGLGDLAVLVDETGRTWYSQQHCCDGSLPGAAKDGETRETEERFSNAADITAYLAAFPMFHPQDGWTNNKLAVFDDSRWHSLSFP